MAAAIMGLAAVLHTSALAFQTIKVLGVAYLLYMAWNDAAGDGGASGSKRRPAPARHRRVIWSAILINLLNPKLSIFFLAFLPQFVSRRRSTGASAMVGLSAVFMLLTFVVFVAYGLIAAAFRGQIISRPRALTWLRRTFAGAFVALGARLALADRESDDKGPSASLAPSTAGSTYSKYTSPAAFGRRLAAGPSSSL